MGDTVLRLRADGSAAVETETDGIRSTKEISPDALLECLDLSAKGDGVRSGQLPQGCLSFAARMDGGKEVWLMHGAERADIWFMGTAYESFPLPRLAFGFSLGAGGKVLSCRLAVTEDEPWPKWGSPTYRWPFANVYGSGEVCLGRNPLPKYPDLRALAGLAHRIVALPHNMDGFSAAGNKKGAGMRELLEEMKGKGREHYYKEVLARDGRTLADHIGGRAGQRSH